MQYRKMLPTWGRFTSPDPGWDQNPEDPQSWNLNSYVRNNPVMMVDPDGQIGVGPDGGSVTRYWMNRFSNWLFSPRSSQPSGGASSSSNPNISKGRNVEIRGSTAKGVEKQIETNAAAVGVESLKISNGHRTPEGQANIMLEMIEDKGLKYASDLYTGPAGRAVIVAYNEVVAEGGDREAQAAAMTKVVGANKSSFAHVDDRAVDISPGSITPPTKRGALVEKLKSDPSLKIILPPKDPAIHVERRRK